MMNAPDATLAEQHIAEAERLSPAIDGLPEETAPRAVGRVGIIGAGTMGGGIAMNFLSAGIPVTIVETEGAALERGMATIRKNYDRSVARGRLTSEQVDATMALLTGTLDFERLADCDLVIEAVYENLDVKKEVFARLDAVARDNAILASNTSYLDLDAIADVTRRPKDVVGLHFFSPANIMKLVEVVRGAKTAPDVLGTVMGLAKAVGKIPVLSGVCHGFIGNRMLIPRRSNAIALLLEGGTPEQIDRVHTDFGMPMGPFQMTDLAGVDIGWHRDPARVESIQDALCARGRLGQKAGAGYYDYDAARKPQPSAVTEAIIADWRAEKRIVPRAITQEEIVVRTQYTMINEAALILEEGIAQRASDIDVVWVNGYGWPRRTGGPLFWAEQIGLPVIVAALQASREQLGPGFRLSGLLEDCAAGGRRLERPNTALR